MNLTLLGRNIDVISMAPNDLEVISNQKGCLGYFDGTHIYLSSLLTGDEYSRVLVHEACHAIFAVSGLTNLLDDNLEEALCDALEGLIQCQHILSNVKTVKEL